jgi:hypothetical protein
MTHMMIFLYDSEYIAESCIRQRTTLMTGEPLLATCEEPTNGPFRYSEAQGDGAGNKCEQGVRRGERSRMKR